MTVFYQTIPSPIGELTIATTEAGVCRVGWENDKYFAGIPSDWILADELHVPVIQQLEEYFAGNRTEFDLPVKQVGTDFQQAVWQALCKIPYGETRSYGEQAVLLNNPKAVRAVGAANGRNQVPIIVPCHRVIGANGSLTGFAGGTDVKHWLLQHEASQKELF